MTTAAQALAAASREVTRLAEAAKAHHVTLAAIREDSTYSDDYKRELVTQERERFNALLSRSNGDAIRSMDEARTLASRRLSTPGDSDTETRKSRAAMRVSRLIDAGTPAGAAAELFAEAGDLDALRALRDEVPSWVAATLPRPYEGTRRQKVTDDTLLLVDRLMAPFLTGEDAEAVEVRLGVDHVAAQLKATVEHAFNNSPHSRFVLGLANSPALGMPSSSGSSSGLPSRQVAS